MEYFTNVIYFLATKEIHSLIKILIPPIFFYLTQIYFIIESFKPSGTFVFISAPFFEGLALFFGYILAVSYEKIRESVREKVRKRGQS